MTRFEPGTGLDEWVAQQILRPEVDACVREIAAEGARRAPAAKVWISQRDNRVRPSHVNTDGQEIPENLRYEVTDRIRPIALLRVPRDENGPLREVIGCRCSSVPLPGRIGQLVTAEPVYVAGTRVIGRVSVQFPRIAEAHNASSPDVAVPFLADAVTEVARRRTG